MVQLTRTAGTENFRSLDSSHTALPWLFPTFFFLFPIAIKMSRKLINATNREMFCYKYREVWLAVLMAFHAVLWQWLVCWSTRSDSVISGPASSHCFYFILYLSCRSSYQGFRVTVLSVTYFSNPPTWVMDFFSRQHVETHTVIESHTHSGQSLTNRYSKEGNCSCQETKN